MDVPNVSRTEYQLVNIEDVSQSTLGGPLQEKRIPVLIPRQGFLNLMDGDGNSKDDVKIPESDLGKEIEAAFEDGKDCMVTIIAAMGTYFQARRPLPRPVFVTEKAHH